MTTANNSQSAQSRMISFLRFPMMVLVVCIHASIFRMDMHPLLGTITMRLLVGSLARIAVPLFFFFSGFLFFNDADFSFGVYKEKLKRRVRSLLIPYFIWNGALLIVLSMLHPESVFDDGQGLMGKFLTCISAFFNYKGTSGPVSIQFWFIRDLILLNVAAPIIHYVVARPKFGYVAVSALLLLWICVGDGEVHLFNLVAVAFYALGALLAVNRIKLDNIAGRFGGWSYLYLAFVAVDVLFPQSQVHAQIHNIGLIFGVLFALKLSYDFVTRDGYVQNDFLPSVSFFLFAFHDPWCFSINKKVLSIIGLQSGVGTYFVFVCMAVVVSLLVYYVLCRTVPGFVKMINGNRCYEYVRK